MAIRDIAYLKAKFETGDVPTQDDFHDWLDTMFSFLGGSDFDPHAVPDYIKLINLAGASRWIGAYNSSEGDVRNSNITFGDGYISIIDNLLSPYRAASLLLKRLEGEEEAGFGVNSPTGNNYLKVYPAYTEVQKVMRYAGTLALSHDLDHVYKSWIEERWSTLWQTIAPSAFLVLDCLNRKFPRFNCSLGSAGVGLFVDNPTYLIEGSVNVLTTAATSGLITLDTAYIWVLNGEFITTYQLPNGIGKYHVLNFKYNNGIMLLNVGASSGSGASDTDMLPEGSVNLYFTNARAVAALASTLSGYALSSTVAAKADTTYVDAQDKKFKLDLEFQSGSIVSYVYFETTATLTLCRKESTISTIEYSTNSGGSYSSIAVGVLSLAIPATTYVIFRITYVTPSYAARGNVYLEGTY